MSGLYTLYIRDYTQKFSTDATIYTNDEKRCSVSSFGISVMGQRDMRFIGQSIEISMMGPASSASHLGYSRSSIKQSNITFASHLGLAWWVILHRPVKGISVTVQTCELCRRKWVGLWTPAARYRYETLISIEKMKNPFIKYVTHLNRS